MRIIGLHGEMESGKDTVGSILVEQHGYYAVSIGRHIRREILECHVTNIDGYMPNDVLRTVEKFSEKRMREAIWAKPTTPEIRKALQWYGHYWYCKDPEHWLSQVRLEIDQAKKQKIVFTDIRRSNEFNLAVANGEVWCVIRAKELGWHTEYNNVHMYSHITETGLRGYPFKQYISNNGDIADLEQLVGMIVREYKL